MTATRTPTLTAFLTAQLDADEAAARADGFHAADCERLHPTWIDGLGPLSTECDCGYPARVLAQVRAMRQIVRAYESANMSTGVDYELGFGLDLAVRAIASIWKDAPGFDTGWAE